VNLGTEFNAFLSSLPQKLAVETLTSSWICWGRGCDWSLGTNTEEVLTWKVWKHFWIVCISKLI